MNEKELRAAILEMHRALYPEKHEDYWAAQPKENWPYGWEGPGNILEWSSETIEWIADNLDFLVHKAELLEDGAS